jgi:hypothetical protein
MITVIVGGPGAIEVWSDCDGEECSGRCIGLGSTKAAALADARQELSSDLEAIGRLEQETA